MFCMCFHSSLSLYNFFFFFYQKTAYEVRISAWSSDVCSSDLANYDPPKPAFTSSVVPLARDVRDPATVLQALAGPDGRDFIAQPNVPADYLAELDSGVQDMRFAWTDDFGYADMYAMPDSPEIGRAHV